MRVFILGLSLIVFFIGWIFQSKDFLFYSVLLIFIQNIFYGFKNFKSNIVFLMFNLTFFVFLIGRIFLGYFLNYSPKILGWSNLAFNDNETIIIILQVLFMGLFFVYLGHSLASRLKLFEFISKRKTNINFLMIVRKVSFVFICITVLPRYLILYEMVVNTVNNGYYETFASFQSSYPSVIKLLSSMFDVAIFSYLVTNPDKKKSTFAILLYFIEGLLGAISGRRSMLMLNILIILIYFVYRHSIKSDKEKEKHWIGFKEKMLSIILFPVAIIGMTIIGNSRGSTSGSNENSFLSFFYSQGISANLIGYVEKYEEVLPNKGKYTFGPFFEFVSNSIIRPINNLPPLTGQNLIRVNEGFLLSHSISFFIMPTLYLAGVGYGSSFLAELYIDFSYLGVILGSLGLGIILFSVKKMLWSTSIFLKLISLMMIRQLMFVPRASYFSFIVSTFTPVKIFAIVSIFSLSYILWIIKRERYV